MPCDATDGTASTRQIVTSEYISFNRGKKKQLKKNATNNCHRIDDNCWWHCLQKSNRTIIYCPKLLIMTKIKYFVNENTQRYALLVDNAIQSKIDTKA